MTRRVYLHVGAPKTGSGLPLPGLMGMMSYIRTPVRPTDATLTPLAVLVPPLVPENEYVIWSPSMTKAGAAFKSAVITASATTVVRW